MTPQGVGTVLNKRGIARIAKKPDFQLNSAGLETERHFNNNAQSVGGNITSVNLVFCTLIAYTFAVMEKTRLPLPNAVDTRRRLCLARYPTRKVLNDVRVPCRANTDPPS